MTEKEFPVLKLRADGPAGMTAHIYLDDEEISRFVRRVEIDTSYDGLNEATLTIICIPDVELPAALQLELEAVETTAIGDEERSFVPG